LTDYGDMLADPELDIIVICTPHALHAPMTLEAANAGKHVLVEKPMALTVQDASAMIESAKKNKVRLWVVKQNRFNVPIQLTSNIIREGKLGRLFMIQCEVLWNRHDAYYSDSPWRGKLATEGGALFTQVSHFIDLLIMWCGDVVEATGLMDRQHHAIEIEDAGSANLVFENGTLGSVVWTTNVYNKNYEGSITIIGEYGTIKIGGPYLNKIDYWDVQSIPIPDHSQFIDRPNLYGKYQGTSSNHDKVVKQVINDLKSGSGEVVDGAEGIRSVAAIEMIYRTIKRLK